MSQPSTTGSFEYELEAKDPNTGLWVLVGLILLIIGAFIFLRSEPSHIGGTAELSAMLSDGQPKVLEFYSNF